MTRPLLTPLPTLCTRTPRGTPSRVRNARMSSTCEFRVTTCTDGCDAATPARSASNECPLPCSGDAPVFVLHNVRSKSKNTHRARVDSINDATSSPSPQVIPHASHDARSHAMHFFSCGQNALFGHFPRALTGHSPASRFRVSHSKHDAFVTHRLLNRFSQCLHFCLPDIYMRGPDGGHSPAAHAARRTSRIPGDHRLRAVPSFKATSGWSSKASEAELKGVAVCRD
eukprot:31563-Pelagococcus_subviridis.AAC.2